MTSDKPNAQSPHQIINRISRSLDKTMLTDRRWLRQQLQRIRGRIRKKAPVDQMVIGLQERFNKSMNRAKSRRQSQPTLNFPEHLPVVNRRDEIAHTIKKNQVVVLCGETGSGKTTQLPKICLGLGRGVVGMIGMTQPRRIAARSIANYLAEDLKTQVGQSVGMKIRFSDQTGPDTRIKIMTDGMLLAETQGDSWLNSYDTLIIDEAHERSLNIDFLLGYIHHLLKKRPDLKLIISSATLDTDKFSKHFNNAPILEVSGRTWPVEVRYQPLKAEGSQEAELDLSEGVVRAVDELRRDLGDVLVFLPGEREIRESADLLRKQFWPGVEILPLYARLSAKEQTRIFHPGSMQRVVLATNVAETSITVPGIRYVVDSGLARISRFSGRPAVQRLPVERISQSSADQRKGRCGRLSEGICIRLYSEQDFNNRPVYTDPEILRTSLASVILQMAWLKLGVIEDFPFVDQPEVKAVREGWRQLHELNALNDDDQLTETGRQLAQLSADPQLARMLLAARENGSLTELLIIVSAMSVQDPRESPAHAKESARQAHALLNGDNSDFITLVNLWNTIETQRQNAPTRSQYRKWLKKNYLAYMRIREWQDIHRQISHQIRGMGGHRNQKAADYNSIHQAILTGLLGNIGFKSEKHSYTGGHGSRFHVFPGSGLFKKSPKWLMAGELVETTRLYARTCARIEPEWIERAAVHLIRKSYSDPHWEKRAGQVVAYERVTLYGLIIVPQRKVNFGPIDPETSRELFIRAALVAGEMTINAKFFQHNQRLLAEISQLENKSRRRDVLVDDETLYQFFDQIIPENVNSVTKLNSWRRKAEKNKPRLLYLSREDLMRHAGEEITTDLYPGHLVIRGQEFSLEYHFDPGNQSDGISVRIPISLLNKVTESAFQWLVPGLLEEKVQALLRQLPKSLRRPLVPLPQTVQLCIQELKTADGALIQALEKVLFRRKGLRIPANTLKDDALPDHLRMQFIIVDEKNKQVLARGRDIEKLRKNLGSETREQFQALPKNDFERTQITQWNFGPLPDRIAITETPRIVYGYPALRDEEKSVSLILADSPEQAWNHTHNGLRRLFLIQMNQQVKQIERNLIKDPKICVAFAPLGKCDQLRKGIIQRTADQVFLSDKPNSIRDQETFNNKLQQGRSLFVRQSESVSKLAGRILLSFQETKSLLKGNRLIPNQKPIVEQLNAQLAELIHPGFLTTTPWKWLNSYPRYLEAIRKRLQRRAENPGRDDQKQAELKHWESWYTQRLEHARKNREINGELVLFRWMLEEFRVSLFAQELKTSIPISAKRLEKQKRLIL
ncbi:MAG: ATP-dependent RNA helicase HrpA [Magnetococcales bacterium]|nr:ATP-dependent RNA helicase HrpA [Magnetococcales bacterium]